MFFNKIVENADISARREVIFLRLTLLPEEKMHFRIISLIPTNDFSNKT